jgi:hypothetical protein
MAGAQEFLSGNRNRGSPMMQEAVPFQKFETERAVCL